MLVIPQLQLYKKFLRNVAAVVLSAGACRGGARLPADPGGGRGGEGARRQLLPAHRQRGCGAVRAGG